MSYIEELRAAADIADVIGVHVPLEAEGPIFLTGVCPFHADSGRSLYVHRGQQVYHCNGCAASGDVLDFIMAFAEVPYGTAVELLARHCGFPAPGHTKNG